jgi:hypothetical protein
MLRDEDFPVCWCRPHQTIVGCRSPWCPSDTGVFEVVGVPAGPYVVTWSLSNFAQVRRTVALSATTPATADVTMHLALNATVVVTGRDSFRHLADLDRPSEHLVGVASAASEGAVTGRQIAARPIMRPAEVLESVPGVISSQHSGEGQGQSVLSARL